MKPGGVGGALATVGDPRPGGGDSVKVAGRRDLLRFLRRAVEIEFDVYADTNSLL